MKITYLFTMFNGDLPPGTHLVDGDGKDIIEAIADQKHAELPHICHVAGWMDSEDLTMTSAQLVSRFGAPSLVPLYNGMRANLKL